MNELSFEAFFDACHGQPPLPWQRRLATQLCREHRWPDLIDLPTASGKTACMDIALFHLAYCAELGEPQRAARRIVFVVDRRIIVDAAAERAAKLVDRLNQSDDPAVHAVRSALLRCGGSQALESFKLRGGMAKERSFAHCPAQPMLISSTVDQIGSRLLFRGYGVRDYSLSLHAGLLGHDTLILLDEAHLSRPLISTANALRRFQPDALPQQSVRVVPLSATAHSEGDRFQLDAEDAAHPLLVQRQSCPKSAELVLCEKARERPKALFETAGLLLADLKKFSTAPALVIVVNRVATARAVFDLFQKQKSPPQIELMIGRSRPLDRDAIAQRLMARCAAGRTHQPDDAPLIVVATQCIEVGADLDFQGLVTECAAMDALRQRFGRLDRLGRFGHSRAAIIGGGEPADDPVYGAAVAATWRWLQQQGSAVDFGIRALAERMGDSDLSDLNPKPRPELQLTPCFLDLLAQTSPRPQYDPDVGALLHGLSDAQEDVRLLWRSSLSGLGASESQLVNEILDAQPPSSLEVLSLSVRAARHWLSRANSEDHVFDVEGVDVAVEDFKLRSDLRGASTIWRQGKDGFIALGSAKDIAPGDLLVLSDRNGCDQWGFAPEAEIPATDLSRQAREALAGTHQRVELLRKNQFESAIAQGLGEHAMDGIRKVLDDIRLEEIDARTGARQLKPLLREALHAGVLEPLLGAVSESLTDAKILRTSKQAFFGVLLYFGRPKREDLSEDDDSSNRIRRKVLLQDHNLGVGQRSLALASAVQLPLVLQHDLSLAGHLHDLGKADPRFQRMLRAGLDESISSGELLAKGLTNDGANVQMGARHEAYSVAVLNAHPALLSSAHDAELVVHLVGSHHGRGRALQPDIDDLGCSFTVEHQGQSLRYRGRPNLGAIESGSAERFAELQQRYGHLGLAYLEALLRLADHQQSEAEANGRSEGEQS